MRIARFVCIAILLLPASAMAEAGPPPPGTYSSVRYIEEADDYVGMNLQIIGDGPRRRVRFEDCEGWCNGAQVWPARVEGDLLTFVVEQKGRDSLGHPYLDRRQFDVRARRGGHKTRLVISVRGVKDVEPEVLKPARWRPAP